MKRITYLIFFTWLSLGVAWAQDIPAPLSPPQLVNDFTNTLSAAERQSLEAKLLAYEDTTSNQFSIVIVSTTGGADIAQYAAKLGEQWGIGKDQKDNGLLILVALDDRRMNISTGYGLEGAIPDALAKRIIENVLKPNFQQQAYYQGLDEATNVLMGLASGEFTADEVSSGGKNLGGLLFLLLIIFFIFVLPFLKNKSDNDNHMGGRGGGVDVFTTLMLMNMLGGGRRGGGGFGGGGGFSGGGGFGGFGGGSFGGGGASGSW
ncbi:TPM domain-containing protein [Penaeicola halotolerans]|uniref:TPM domain-containing protein n=1 Tax=Penaeicola halotolerans TaxID=2793196 RepID=UPI001CF8E4B6|nr:TPM domain-containing protein [Penaeicola halotolerans]